MICDLTLAGSKEQPANPNRQGTSNGSDTMSYTTSVKQRECVVHMARISSNPGSEVDPKLGSGMNHYCFEPPAWTEEGTASQRARYSAW